MGLDQCFHDRTEMERIEVHCIFQWHPANSHAVIYAWWEFKSIL